MPVKPTYKSSIIDIVDGLQDPGLYAIPAPENLSATPVSGSQIDLDWDDSAYPNFASYNVYRDTSPGVTIGTEYLVISGLTSSNHSDTGLSAETTFYYRVTAVDTEGNESLGSTEVNATTLEAVTNVGTASIDFLGTGYTQNGTQVHSPTVCGNILTVEAWVKWNSLSGNQSIITDGGYVRGWEFGLYNSELHIGIENNDSHRSTGYATSNLSTGQWYHVVAIIDGVNGRLKIYVDGVLVKNTSVSSFTDFDGGNSTTIATCFTQSPSNNIDYGSGFNHLLDGKIKDVRIWSGERTESEINATMNDIELDTGVYPNLEWEWAFESGSGSTLVDSTGNQNLTLDGTYNWTSDVPTI